MRRPRSRLWAYVSWSAGRPSRRWKAVPAGIWPIVSRRWLTAQRTSEAGASSPTTSLTSGVPLDVLQQYGTVSRESAIAMAQAIRTQLDATFGIGITGVPGPGEIEGKPAGLAYFAIACADTVHTQEMHVS